MDLGLHSLSCVCNIKYLQDQRSLQQLQESMGDMQFLHGFMTGTTSKN